MADDNEVQIRFTASTDPAEEGIANVHKALNGLSQSMTDASSAAAGLRGALTAALPVDKMADASKAFASVGDQSARAASQLKEMGNAIKAADAAFNSTKQHLAAELKLHEITVDQETAQLNAAVQERLATELFWLDQEEQIVKAAGGNWQKYETAKTAAAQKANLQIERNNETALEKDAAEWQSAMSPVLSAWNSQLRGLLGGTESWSKAMKKIVGDLVIQIIEYFERLAVQQAALGLADMFKGTALGGGPQSFIQGLLPGGGQAGGAAMLQTGATTLQSASLTLQTAATQLLGTGAAGAPLNLLSGAGAGAGAGSAASGAAGAATLTTAGTTLTTAGAGLNTAAAALSTAAASLGAGAAGGAAGSAASGASGIGGIFSSIGSIFGFASGTDNILSGGLAIVHPGESIVPAARGSGPFTGAGMATNTTHISPSINITAMDSRSVARFFNDNAHHMVRALQRGLKSGAHLPLRTAMR